MGATNWIRSFFRRTADVRSVGYSELFSLSREDVLAAMKDYPEAQEILQSLGRKRLMEARSITKGKGKLVSSAAAAICFQLPRVARLVEKTRLDTEWLLAKRASSGFLEHWGEGDRIFHFRFHPSARWTYAACLRINAFTNAFTFINPCGSSRDELSDTRNTIHVHEEFVALAIRT